MNKRLLRTYITEVLTGFRSLNSVGSGGAQGNLRMGEPTLSQKNRGIFDDLEDEESIENQDDTARPTRVGE